MPVQCTCEQCGASFSAAPSLRKRGLARFCSTACTGDSRRAQERRPAAERFWEKVNKDGPIPSHCPELGPCWIWTGSRHPDGRGQFHFRGRTYFASVVAYILTYGDPPPDKPCVLHKCDGGYIACARPDHLFSGTIADNNADMKAKGRYQSWMRLHPERIPRGDQHYLVRRPGLRQGERNPVSKLTEAQVIEARRRYATGGITVKELARQMGCTATALYSVIQRRTWKHVP